MIYEVTRVKTKKLTLTDFEVNSITPFVNWDANPAVASMNILAAMMGGD